MRVKERSKKEIEEKMLNMGDFVKIDYLVSCLKSNLDFETRKFVMVKLAELYAGRRMYLEAGRLMRGAADINITYNGKIKDFMKSVELFIKAGNFDEADVSEKRAMGSANETQKKEIGKTVRELYAQEAKKTLEEGRRKQAAAFYEKILRLGLSPEEKKDAEIKLLNLYESLGKIREYYEIKGKLGK